MKTLISKQIKNTTVALEFKLQDLWVGAFWQRKGLNINCEQHLWLCLLPCLPIHIAWDCSVDAVIKSAKALDKAAGIEAVRDRKWAKRYIELSRNEKPKGMSCGSTCLPK